MALASWGPIFAGRRARQVVELLNHTFGLRDCGPEQAMTFPDQEELFPVVLPAGCIRHEIGNCLGPCTGRISHQAYGEAIQSLRRFLDGADAAPLTQLQVDMMAAAKALDFERAAQLRDRLQLFEWLQRHLARIRQARERHTFIYPVKGVDQDVWYLIRQGWVAAALPAPRDEDSRRQAAAALAEVYGQPRLGVEPRQSEGIDGVLLVSAWFRRHPRELKRVMSVAQASEWLGAARAG
jgi:excinuclease ABC subunit C